VKVSNHIFTRLAITHVPLTADERLITLFPGESAGIFKRISGKIRRAIGTISVRFNFITTGITDITGASQLIADTFITCGWSTTLCTGSYYTLAIGAEGKVAAIALAS
jgi:hypothetical protein